MDQSALEDLLELVETRLSDDPEFRDLLEAILIKHRGLLPPGQDGP